MFYNSEKIILEDRKLELFLNGVKLTNKKRDGIYKIYNNNKFIGIGVVKDELLKRDIIIIWIFFMRASSYITNILHLPKVVEKLNCLW